MNDKMKIVKPFVMLLGAWHVFLHPHALTQGTNVRGEQMNESYYRTLVVVGELVSDSSTCTIYFTFTKDLHLYYLYSCTTKLIVPCWLLIF